MANAGSKNRRKRDGKKGQGRKPAPTKDLGSTTAVAVGDLSVEAGSPLALASEAYARETATAEAIAVVEAAMKAQPDGVAAQAALQAAPPVVDAPRAEVRDRAGPQVRVKVHSGESRGSASQFKAVESAAGEVTVSRWLRDASEPKVAAVAAAKPKAREALKLKGSLVPTYVDQPTRRSTTWLWVFAAAIGLVTWIMLDRPSKDHELAAVAPPSAPIAERGPDAPSEPAKAVAKTRAPVVKTAAVPTQPAKVTPPKTVVAKVAPAEVAKVTAPEVAKVAPPIEVAKVDPPIETAKADPPKPQFTPDPVVETAPPVPNVAPTPEILALAERISADEPPKVEAPARPVVQVAKRPARKVAPRPSKAWYDEVPPQSADARPRDYDDVMPLSGVRVVDEETLTRGRQYDHVPPRAALPQGDNSE